MRFKIRKLRLHAQLSQNELATRMGVTQGAVSQWETGESNPQVSALPELARALGCSIDELYEDADKDAEQKGA